MVFKRKVRMANNESSDDGSMIGANKAGEAVNLSEAVREAGMIAANKTIGVTLGRLDGYLGQDANGNKYYQTAKGAFILRKDSGKMDCVGKKFSEKCVKSLK